MKTQVVVVTAAVDAAAASEAGNSGSSGGSGGGNVYFRSGKTAVTIAKLRHYC